MPLIFALLAFSLFAKAQDQLLLGKWFLVKQFQTKPELLETSGQSYSLDLSADGKVVTGYYRAPEITEDWKKSDELLTIGGRPYHLALITDSIMVLEKDPESGQELLFFARTDKAGQGAQQAFQAYATKRFAATLYWGEIYKVVETQPCATGCELEEGYSNKNSCATEKVLDYIETNLGYPAEAKANKIQGTVYVNFIVEMDGTLTNFKVVRDIGGGCGDAVVKALKQMPKWQCGKQRGRPVRVTCFLSVKFSLQNRE